MSEIKALLEKIEESKRICADILIGQVKFAAENKARYDENKKLLRGISEVAGCDLGSISRERSTTVQGNLPDTRVQVEA